MKKTRKHSWQLLTIATFLFFGGGGYLNAQTWTDVTDYCIVNPSFEGGATQAMSYNTDRYLYAPDGWSVYSSLYESNIFTFVANSFTQDSRTWTAYSGNAYMLRDRWAAATSTIHVKQTIPVLHVGTYKLTFQGAHFSANGDARAQVVVTVNGVAQPAVVITRSTTDASTWNEYSCTFPYTSGTVDIEFTNRKGGGNSKAGIDEFRLYMDTEEPAETVMADLATMTSDYWLDQLDNAPGNVLDYTSKIFNNGVNTNTDYWKNENVVLQINPDFPLKEGDRYAERWSGSNTKFSNDTRLAQTLTGLPNGIYKLTVAAGFSRFGGYVYANNDRTPIANDDATNQDYSVITTVTDGVLRLGIEALTAEQSNVKDIHCYFRFDNFRLEYQGPEAYVLFKQLPTAIAAAQAKAEVCAGSVDAVDLLNAAINAASGLTMDNTAAELQTSINNLKAAIAAADVIVAGGPVDVTHYIQNPSVNDNLNYWTGFNVLRQGNPDFGLKEGASYAERWEASRFGNNTRLEQTITDLPNGIYKLTVAAGFNYSGSYLYANTYRTPITGDNVNRDYSVIATVTDGTLKVGVEAISSELSGSGSCYFRFDNFRLEYQAPEILVLFDQIEAAIAVAQAKAGESVDFGAYPNAVNALNTAISAASGLTMNTTVAELQTAVDNLNAAITAADAMIANYTQLKVAIDFAKSFPNTYDGYPAFDSAITTAQSVYDNSTEQDVAAAIAVLTAAIRTYRLTQPANFETPANFTFAIVNPQFDNGIAGWTEGMTTYNQGESLYTDWTKYSNDTDIYTTVPSNNVVLDRNGNQNTLPWEAEQVVAGLPEGYYRVKVVARGSATETATMFIEASTRTDNIGTAPIRRVGNTGNDLTFGWARYELPYLKLTSGEALTLGVEVRSHGGNDNTWGWASVDNFELWYYGNTLTDLQLALLNLQDRYEAAQALTSSNMNATVASQLSTAINNATEANTLTISTVASSDYDAARLNGLISDLETAIAAANSSIANYTANYVAYGKLLDKISIMSDKYFAAGFEDEKNSIYSIYEAYRPAYLAKEIEATASELTALQSALDGVLSEIAVGLTNATNLVANAPTVAAATGNQKAVPTGWTGVEQTPDDKYTTSGQHPDAANKTYFDSWSQTVGALKFTVNQTVSLPAGSYVLSSEARSSGAGAYVYAYSGGEYYFTEITINYDQGGALGRGWNTIYVPFSVPDGGGDVVIGITNNKAERLGDDASAVAWAGTWYSATNFKLLRDGHSYNGDAAVIGDITDKVEDIVLSEATLDLTKAIASIPVTIPNENKNLIVINTPNSNISVANAINVVNGEATHSDPVVLHEMHPFSAPHDITFANGINYVRNSTVECGIDEEGSTSGWQSIILPFDVASITAIQDGATVTLVPFDLFDTETLADNCRPFWLYAVEEGQYVPATTIEAHKPYLFAVPNSADYAEIYNINGEITFSGAAGTTISATPDIDKHHLSELGYSVEGSFSGANPVGTHRLDPVDGSRWISDDGGVANSFHVGAHAVSPAPYLNIFMENEGVGIKEILAPTAKGTAKGVYTIDGRRIATDSLPDGALPAGIYIINGEKVVIK